MTPRTITPSSVGVKRARAVGVIAVLLGAAVAWAVVTFAVGTANQTVSGPTAFERHYANAIASLDDAQVAAAFGTEPLPRAMSTGRALRSLNPPDRRYVRAITRAHPSAAVGRLRCGSPVSTAPRPRHSYWATRPPDSARRCR
jgi:hypothetical protein